MDEIKVSLFKGECFWTEVKVGEALVLLTPVEVKKLISELEATIS